MYKQRLSSVVVDGTYDQVNQYLADHCLHGKLATSP
jgi:hypothetical protein